MSCSWESIPAVRKLRQGVVFLISWALNVRCCCSTTLRVLFLLPRAPQKGLAEICHFGAVCGMVCNWCGKKMVVCWGARAPRIVEK